MVLIHPLSIFFPSDLDIEEKRKRAIMVLGGLIGVPVLLFFVYYDFMVNDIWGVIFDGTLTLFFTVFLVFSRNVRDGIWFYRIIMAGLGGVMMYNAYFGPSGDSSLIWLQIFPSAVIFVLGIPEGLVWLFLLTAMSTLVIYFPDTCGAYHFSDDMRMRFLSAYIIITFLALSFEFLRWYFYTQLEQERQKLKEAMEKVHTLDGLVPICSMCKKIRDDKGYWNQLEQYLIDHTDAKLTHGICDDCYAKHYPKEFARRKTKSISIVDLPEKTDETAP